MPNATTDQPGSPETTHKTPPAPACSFPWRRAALLLLAGLLGWRLLYLAIFPLGLVPDESYYWDWTRSLDWSYFSKPPMVAWLIALSTAIFGNNEFGVRLPAALLGVGSLTLIWLLARRMFDDRTAFWAVAATAGGVGFAVGGYIMTIDAPLLFSWCLALYAFWRWQETGGGNLTDHVGQGVSVHRVPQVAASGPVPRTPVRKPGRSPQPAVPGERLRGNRWLLLAILACGLGLLSKLIMAVFLGLAFLFVFSARRLPLPAPGASESPAAASTPPPSPATGKLAAGTLLLSLGALLFLLPFLLWNARYDWITFQHTGDAFGSSQRSVGQALGWALDFVGGQIGLGGPVVMLLLIPLLAMAWRVPDRRIRFLWCFSAVPLAVVLLLSFNQRINANWPLAFYPAAYIMIAAWACGHVSVQPGVPIPGGRWQALFRPGIVVGLVLVALLYALPWLSNPLGLTGGKQDPGLRLRTWPETASAIDPHWRAFKAQHPEAFLLVAGGRDLTSSLAFYLSDQPLVYRWTGSTAIGTQYELWEGPETRLDHPALIVVEGYEQPLPAALANRFRQTTRLAALTAQSAGGRHQRQVTLYHGDTLQAWVTGKQRKVPR